MKIIWKYDRKSTVIGIVGSIMLLLCMCTLFGRNVKAADVYTVTQNEAGITATHNSEALKDAYLAVVKSGNEYKVVKPGTSNSVVYYFDGVGKGSVYSGSSFVSIAYDGKLNTYYLDKGNIVYNQIVGNKKDGYYYVDTTGIQITDKTTKLAVKFVRAHTKSSDSKEKKLKKCYHYLAKKYKYKRTHKNLYPKAKHMQSMAYEMLKNKKGNCHRYAASFAYIARVLGYDVRVVVGKVSSNHGGMTPHGWDEVKFGKKWYVFDPDMQYNNKVDGYKKKRTPCKTSVTRRCKMTAKDGKITWK